MELILGLIFVTSWVMVAPKVIADAVTTMRASKAGAWDTIDKQRERKDKKAASRREAISKAWAATRAARNKRAGGDGKYRPGAKAYMGDLYHGFWEDKLEKRKVKRAARPPYEYDPNKLKLRDRVDAKVAGKVQGLREKSGRFGRALINPVGEGRQDSSTTRPSPPAQPVPDEVTPEVADVVNSTGTKCGICTVEPAERYIPPIGQETPLPACIECYNDVLDARWESTQRQQGVVHDSDEYTVPAPQVVTAAEINANSVRLAPDCPRCGWVMVAPPYDGPGLSGPGELFLSPYVCPNCSKTISTRIDHNAGTIEILKPVNVADTVDKLEQKARTCEKCGSQNVNRSVAWSPDHAEAHYTCRDCGATSTQLANVDPAPGNTNNDLINGGTMSSATGDVHDVETCKAECVKLADDLSRIDTTLDVLDELVRAARDASEHIEAWLGSKNADASVSGMRTVLDMLSADNVKALIDAVSGARQGVQETIDSLSPLEEAAELVGDADGSILNGR